MSPEPQIAVAGLFIGMMVLIGLATYILMLVAIWRIVSKTGHPGVLSLLFLIPIANIILFLILAFGQWPIERELQALRAQAGYGARPPLG